MMRGLRMNAATPFGSAAVLWHLSDRRPARGTGELLVHGAVTLGAELSPADADASRMRAGNGRAAGFAGGYLEVPPAGLPRLTGAGMSLCALRRRDYRAERRCKRGGATPRRDTRHRR